MKVLSATRAYHTSLLRRATSRRLSGLLFLKQFIFRFYVWFLKIILHPRIADNPKLFYLVEKHGYHITKVHFYSPIPNVMTLGEHIWSRPYSLGGIDMNTAQQLSLLAEVQQKYKLEYDNFPLEEPQTAATFWINNGMFVSVDAEMLYSMIRYLRPKRIIEVGCGFSTRISETAIEANRQEESAYRCDFTCVDPYPPAWLNEQSNHVSRLVRQPVQAVGAEAVEELEMNDILFIDSSHVAAIGSDVTWEVLELLPRLRPGVVVHFHDIFMPYEYPREWIKEKKSFWNEQYILQAFLAFNGQFEIVWAGHYMHQQSPDKLSAAFRSYDPKNTMPASLWLRRKVQPE
jgi:hypothetical protein